MPGRSSTLVQHLQSLPGTLLGEQPWAGTEGIGAVRGDGEIYPDLFLQQKEPRKLVV